MRMWLRLVLAGCLTVSGFAALVPTAAAATTQDSARLTLTSTNRNPDVAGVSGEWDSANARVEFAKSQSDQLQWVFSGGTPGHRISLDLHPVTGERIALGHHDSYDHRGAYLNLMWGENSCEINEWDIADLAYTGNTIVRIDLVFTGTCRGLTVSSFQFGYPTTALGSGTRRMVWPETAVATTSALVVPVLIRNTTTANRVVDPSRISGAQAGEFIVTSDGCVGRTLRPGEACTVQIGFTPRSAGAKAGVLAVSSGSDVARVALSASAPSGHTVFSLNSEPGEYVGDGHAYLYTEAQAQFTASAAVGSVELNVRDGSSDWSMWLRTQSYPEPLQLGTHRLGYAPVDPTGYELSVGGEGRGCGGSTGTVTINELAYDTLGHLLRFHMTFRQSCIGSTRVLTGEVAYRATARTGTPSGSAVLRTGETLRTGQDLRTILEGAVVARLAPLPGGRVVITDRNGDRQWVSPGAGFDRFPRLTVRPDGSLAILGTRGITLWSVRPGGALPGDFLLLQSDGTLVLYSPDLLPLWSSRTLTYRFV